MEEFTKGFTQIPHKIDNILPLMNLNKRGYKVVLLIIRLTYGCQRRWAKLNLADLQVVGIAPPHARKVIEGLLSKSVIVQNGKTKEYRLDEDYLASEVTQKVTFKLEKLRSLIKRQLAKDSYQTGNKRVAELVTAGLPEGEDLGYQNSNDERLPNRKVLPSKEHDFSTPKDILNKELNIRIDSNKNIAIKNSSKRSEQVRKANPEFFSPSNETEYAAKTAWEQIEPENKDSFGFYLWAIKQGVSASKFFELASEIKTDPNIKKKGAVFNKKVMDYLRRK